MNRTAWAARPGDVFKWSSAKYGLANVVLRIKSYNLGTLERGEITLECVQDRFTVGQPVFAVTPPSELVEPSATLIPIEDRLVIEAPRWAVLQSNTAEDFANLQRSHLYALALNPGGGASTFDIHAKEAVATEYGVDRRQCRFAANATLLNDYDYTSSPVDIADDLIIRELTNPSVLDTVTEDEARAGRNLILFEHPDGTHEFAAFLDFTDNMDDTYTLHTVARGLMDTVPQNHLAGAVVWFINPVSDSPREYGVPRYRSPPASPHAATGGVRTRRPCRCCCRCPDP